MPRGRSSGFDEQRDAIVACAAQLFAERGFAAASMAQVAQASGLSKPTLYHYVRDKEALLAQIALDHVHRLQALLAAARADASARADGAAPTRADGAAPTRAQAEATLRRVIVALVGEYAHAQHAHRVLTEDVKFLAPDDRARVLDAERAVVRDMAALVVAARPELSAVPLGKPLTMLLFGMVNWMFTWMRPGGALSHAQIAPVVADLFVGGLAALALDGAVATPPDAARPCAVPRPNAKTRPSPHPETARP